MEHPGLSTPLRILPAEPSDMARLAALATALLHSEGYAVEANADALYAAIFDESAPVKLYAQLAWVEEQIVGFVLYYMGYDLLSASNGFHLADIYVEEAYRHRGIGHKLVQKVARDAHVAGGQWVSLTHLRANVNAAKFYSALGFTEVPVTFVAAGPKALAAL